MTPRGGAGRTGFCHGAFFYGSDEELVSVVAAFLDEGVAGGEPVLAALGADHARLVRAAMSEPAGVSFVPQSVHYDRPAASIRTEQELFDSKVRAGAGNIRMVGEVPHPGVGAPWDGWARYEAALNCVFDPFPVRGLCAYDLRTAPTDVLHDAERTHPFLVSPDGSHVGNDRYQDPLAFMAGRPPPPPDPLEGTLPSLELVSPKPAAARHAVAELFEVADGGAGEVGDLTVAVSEVVTNAMVHGRPPVTLRAWAAPGRMVVTVHDRGPGPSDPFAGLVPAAQVDGTGGRGLWITHQLCPRVTLNADSGGFTVRLVTGAPPG